MNKVEEIFKAWGIMFNPNEQQNGLAAERISICNECEHKGSNVLKLNVCTICGCALSAKVFSPKYNACPMEKWITVENKYYKKLKHD